MDDGEEIERTRHDYVQRVAHPPGSRCNAQHASHNDAGGEGEGGIMVPGPPAESNRAGTAFLPGQRVAAALRYGTPLIEGAYESAVYGYETARGRPWIGKWWVVACRATNLLITRIGAHMHETADLTFRNNARALLAYARA